MVIEFLDRLRSEYLDDKLKLESDKSSLDHKLDENAKLIHKLKEEEDKNFNAFSPRNKNYNYKNSIKNLEKEKKKILDNIEETKKKIEFYDKKLEEIELALKDLKYKFAQMESMEKSLGEIKNFSELRNIYVQKMTSMIHKLDFCSRIAQVDSSRCKVELSDISNRIRETIDEIYKMDLPVNDRENGNQLPVGDGED